MWGHIEELRNFRQSGLLQSKVNQSGTPKSITVNLQVEAGEWGLFEFRRWLVFRRRAATAAKIMALLRTLKTHRAGVAV